MSWNPLSKASPFYLFISCHFPFFLSLLFLPWWPWHCLIEHASVFCRSLAGGVVSPVLTSFFFFFCLACFQKALYLLSLGSTTLCINLLNYAFIYAAVALCKCTLWLNKLFHCLAVCSPHQVFASDIMERGTPRLKCASCLCGLLNWLRAMETAEALCRIHSANERSQRLPRSLIGLIHFCFFFIVFLIFGVSSHGNWCPEKSLQP